MTKDNREPITALDACVLMHTALRKACESKATTAAYNAIHLFGELKFGVDPWRLYGELVAFHVNNGTCGEQACRFALTELRDKWYDRTKKPRQVKRDADRPALYALQSIFKLFNENDWVGMAEYLGEES